MQKTAFILFALTAIVSIIILVKTFTISGAIVTYPPFWYPYLGMQGTIEDKNGLPLWSSASQGQYYNAMIAVSPDGTIVGDGAARSIDYMLTLNVWQSPILIKIGHVDFINGRAGGFRDCTTVYLDPSMVRQDISTPQIYLDLRCDQWESSAGSYG